MFLLEMIYYYRVISRGMKHCIRSLSGSSKNSDKTQRKTQIPTSSDTAHCVVAGLVYQ